MTFTSTFLAELKREAQATRNLLAAVPLAQGDWKPHEKSMSLLGLATHVAELGSWVRITLLQDELDFAKEPYKPFVPTSTEELLAYFDKNIQDAEEVLTNYQDETLLNGTWTMRAGDIIYFTQPKEEVLRTWCFNHLVHHRAQLGVYLRLLNIALPSTYGPTAG
ncbi:MAG: DinB family protein [Bacteroidia bacterium]